MMKSKRHQMKRQAISLLLAILVLAASAAPVLAAVEVGGEGGEIEYQPSTTSLIGKYPPGLLKAELP
jgi:hypothetical protein